MRRFREQEDYEYQNKDELRDTLYPITQKKTLDPQSEGDWDDYEDDNYE
jgi:hypothetical protein